MATTADLHPLDPWGIDEVEGHVHNMTVLVEGAWEPLLAARAALPRAAAAVLDQTVADAAVGRAYQVLARYFIDHPAYRDGDLLPWHLVPLSPAVPGPPGRTATVILGALAPEAFLQLLDTALEQTRAEAHAFPLNDRTVFPCRDQLSLLPASGKLTRSIPARTLGRVRREPARYALVTLLLREDDEHLDDNDEDLEDEKLRVMLRALLGQMAPEQPLPVSTMFRLLLLDEGDLEISDSLYVALEDLDQEPGYSWDPEDDTITVHGDEQTALSTALRLVGPGGEDVALELGRRVDEALVEEFVDAQEAGDFDTAVALVPHLRWRAEQAIAQASPLSLELLRVIALPLSSEDPWALTRLVEQLYATLDNARALQDEAVAARYVLPFVLLAEALGQTIVDPDEDVDPDARSALLDVARSSLRRAGEVLDRQVGMDPQELALTRVHMLRVQASLPDHTPDVRLELLKTAEQLLATPPAAIEQQDITTWNMERFAVQAKIAAVLAAREDATALAAYDQVVAGMAREQVAWAGLRWQVLYERGLLRLRQGDASGGIADLQAALEGMESYPDPDREGEDRLPAPLRFVMARVGRDLARALLHRQEPGDAAEALKVLRKARLHAQTHAVLLSDVLGDIAELEQTARAATRPAHQRRRPRGNR